MLCYSFHQFLACAQVASYEEEEEGSTLSATLTSDDGKVFTFEFLKARLDIGT